MLRFWAHELANWSLLIRAWGDYGFDECATVGPTILGCSLSLCLFECVLSQGCEWDSVAGGRWFAWTRHELQIVLVGNMSRGAGGLVMEGVQERRKGVEDVGS